MIPLLQILTSNPEAAASENPNINCSPIIGQTVGNGGNPTKFEDLLTGIQGENGGNPFKLEDLLTGIQADNVQVDESTGNQTSNKNIALQIIQNPENGVVLFDDVDESVGIYTGQNSEDNPIAQAESAPDTEAKLPALVQLSSGNELQKLLADNRTNPLKAIPVDLLAKQGSQSSEDIKLVSGKSDTTNILFRTNIQNLGKSDQPLADDIFNQKSNVLNLKQVDLIEDSTKAAVKSDTVHKVTTEKAESKSLFDIPTLTRLFPAETASDEGNKTKSTPNIQMAAVRDDESDTTDALIRPTGTTADSSGEGKTGNLLTNNSESGKESGDVSTRSNTGHFAKTLSSEILTAQTNSAAKTTITSSQSDNTNVRFVVPDKLLENGSPNNRTITIKMEPEHLGTIRLTLSSAHHGLTGRMVVDNAATHTIVQSNIDHLFTELSDKGIKLDAFSISVGVDAGGDKSTQERKPFRMNSRGDNDKNISRLESIKPAAIEMRSNRMYVNSSGVNWLA